VKAIADRDHTGLWREVKVFLYRDWWAVRSRYESDFKELSEGVDKADLIEPGDGVLPRLRA
jgi:hypothetical protein